MATRLTVEMARTRRTLRILSTDHGEVEEPLERGADAMLLCSSSVKYSQGTNSKSQCDFHDEAGMLKAGGASCA